VLTSIGKEAQLQEVNGFLTSIDQNGVRNCIGEKVDELGTWMKFTIYETQ
jgi:hypothetical protein